ncbi:neurensin-1-like [Acanthaster planci]|uniref:Neurensin-1-like n=1 Tax=Acanthaster planci TaxID=133434 RepID=A0A8B7YL08_ACAPL|nr:neurensin-1-like [Acanthaster planci]
MEPQSSNNGANGGTHMPQSVMGPGAGSVIRPRPPVPKPTPPPPAPAGSISNAAAASQAAARRKLTRPPRLESVSESEHSDRSCVDSPASSDSFGVKSYLHKFYEEDPAYKDRDDIYCEDEEHPLADLAARKRRRGPCGCCSPVWWKAGAWVGLNILILAILALMVGYFITPRKEVLGYNEDVAVVDEDARKFNRRLDSAKLAGLIMMCAGGLVIAVSLLIPSFCFASDEDSYRDEIRVDAENTFPPYMPIASQHETAEDGIPYTSALTNVQPERAKGEAVIAGKGVVSVQQ